MVIVVVGCQLPSTIIYLYSWYLAAAKSQDTDILQEKARVEPQAMTLGSRDWLIYQQERVVGRSSDPPAVATVTVIIPTRHGWYDVLIPIMCGWFVCEVSAIKVCDQQ